MGVSSAIIKNLRVSLSVGADAHIGSFGSCGFAAGFRKNGLYCRVDVGINPYGILRNPHHSIKNEPH